MKDNDLAHGEYIKWLESISMDRHQAQKFIKVSDSLSNGSTSNHLGLEALYMISTMPESERDKPQQLDSGETKKPDEMTVRECKFVDVDTFGDTFK